MILLGWDPGMRSALEDVAGALQPVLGNLVAGVFRHGIELAAHFLAKSRYPSARISGEVSEALKAYHWPGNIRELRNILERATILADGGQIRAEHLGFLPGLAPARAASSIQSEIAPHPVSAGQSEGIGDVERQMIVAALQSCGGNKSNAAKRLRITRRVLYTKLRKYGLER